MSAESKSETSTAVAAAIAEWFEFVKSGEVPDREEFLGRFPLINAKLRAFFENYETVNEGDAASDPNQPVTPDSREDESPMQSLVTAISIGETSINISSVSTNARYRELKQFNKGGLGNLYRAYDESLHRETAVKMVNDLAASEPALMTQFRVEAEITGRLDHPGVVPVYGFGEEEGGKPFYVMRLIKGRELSLAIKDYHQLRAAHPHGAETRGQLMTLLEQLTSACRTISYAHDVGIIHCDIKPANIMVGKYGETFVLDWGLAATFERAASLHEQTILRPRTASESSTNGPRGGTYGYISPEQLSVEDPIAPTSDVYSLGATLYEILTGKPPFNGRDTDVATKIREGKFPRPHSVVRMIPRRLEAICLKAMSLAPEDRYATATLLARDLTAWMRDEELLVAPDRWFNRIARATRRNRAVTVSVAIASLVIAATTLWTMYETEKYRYVQQQNSLVQQSLDTSLKTLEDLCRPLANGEMHDLSVLIPSMHTINEFTNDYLKKYETLTSMQSHTGRVFELRATLARILSPDTTEVLKYYKQAEYVYENEIKSVKDEIAKVELQRRLTDVKMNRGAVLIQRTEYDNAEEVLHQARELAEKLHHENRNVPGLERDLASVYHLLGQVHLDREAEGQKYANGLDDSKAFFEDSANLLNKLLRTAEGVAKRELQRDLSRSYGYLGDLYLYQGHIAKAERCYKDSEELRYELFDADKSDAEYRFQYARGLGNFGYLERCYRGNLNDAIDHLDKTQVIQSKLVEDFPELDAFQVELAYTENSLAEVYVWQAVAQPERKAEFLPKAKDFASRAATHLEKDPSSKAGVAWSVTTQAAISLLEEPEGPDALRLANKAMTLLMDRPPGVKLGRSDLLTKAIALSIRGEAEDAYKAIKEAVSRGENTGMRFEKHGQAGLRKLDADPKFGTLYRTLCKEVLSDLKDN